MVEERAKERAEAKLGRSRGPTRTALHGDIPDLPKEWPFSVLSLSPGPPCNVVSLARLHIARLVFDSVLY